MRYFLRSRCRFTHLLAAAMSVSGLGLLIAGSWIPLKADLAQFMMNHSWQRALAGEQEPPPWPWADTWPVARLTLPDGSTTVVLSGTSGHALAFAPGHMVGTPMPGAEGNAVVAAHRDTHFRSLREVGPGDPILVQRPDGRLSVYRVTRTGVVDQADLSVLRQTRGRHLTLITCYPFDTLETGGPLRYVVQATAGGVDHPHERALTTEVPLQAHVSPGP